LIRGDRRGPIEARGCHRALLLLGLLIRGDRRGPIEAVIGRRW